MKKSNLKISILILTIVFSTVVLFFPLQAVADDLPVVPGKPGVLGTPWDDGYEYDCDYEIDYDSYSQMCLGIIPLVSASYPLTNFPYLDGPNSWLYEHEYLEPGTTNELHFREVEAYVPLILVESEEWYSHTFELTTTSTQSTSVSFTYGIGGRKGLNRLYFGSGLSTATTTQTIAGWTETLLPGETAVIYIKMKYIQIYGTLHYVVNIPFNPPTTYETIEYDGLFLQEILWDHPYTIKYGPDSEYGEVPLEIPSGQAILDPDPYDQMPASMYRASNHIESFTTSFSFDIGAIAGTSMWTGIFLNIGYDEVNTQENELAFKHTFTKILENTNNQYFEDFYLRYDNAMSVNIAPNRISTGEIVFPTNGYFMILGDDLTCRATAHDDEGISAVQFKVGTTGSWNNAYWSELTLSWMWTWYDQPAIGSYNIYCRVVDTGGRTTIIDSVTVNTEYGIIQPYCLSDQRSSARLGGINDVKTDNNVYYKVKTAKIGQFLWWPITESLTRIYFTVPYICVNVKLYLQIAACDPDVTINIKYTDGTLSVRGIQETSGYQEITLDLNKKVSYVEFRHYVWYSYQWLWIDFINIKYKVT